MPAQTVEARITEVVRDAKNPIWVRAKTDHATVKRIDMNQDEHAREAMALLASGETAVIEINHVQKPREGGGVWDNYYWQRVVANAQPPMPEIPVEAQPPARPTDKGDAWRICLSLGAKLAVQTLPLITKPEDMTFPAQADLALAWGTFIYSTPTPEPGRQQALAPSAGNGAYSGDPTGYPGEDDIPF
jgi:hypothetical protein